EKLLRLRGERRGAAKEGAQIMAKSLLDFVEDQFLRHQKPESAQPAGVSPAFPLPSHARFFEEGTDGCSAFGKAFFHSAPHAFQQRRHIQEVVRRRKPNLIRK